MEQLVIKVRILKNALNSKAPGPDGIPNEFWKLEIKRCEKKKKKKKKEPNETRDNEPMEKPCITALMTKVLKDIN